MFYESAGDVDNLLNIVDLKLSRSRLQLNWRFSNVWSVEFFVDDVLLVILESQQNVTKVRHVTFVFQVFTKSTFFEQRFLLKY